MIFGYSPTKSRIEFKRRFSRYFSNSIYINERIYKKHKQKVLLYTLLFWVFMLFGLRMGSLFFSIFAPHADSNFSRVPVRLPGNNIYGGTLENEKTIYVKNYSSYIYVFVDRSLSIRVNENSVYLNELSQYINSNFSKIKIKQIFFFADESVEMEIVIKIIHSFRKSGFYNFMFITKKDGIGVWQG